MPPKSYHDYARIIGSASEPQIIENFEDGNVNEYSKGAFPSPKGTGSFSASTSTVQNGTYSGRLVGDGNGTLWYTSTSGLPQYPEQGDKFRGYYQTDTHNDFAPIIVFGYQDDNNTYFAFYDHNNEDLVIQKMSGGSKSTISSKTTSLNEFGVNSWEKAELEWQEDGTLIFRLLNTNDDIQDSVTGSDTEFSSGGFGFGVYDNNQQHKVWYDDWRLV